MSDRWAKAEQWWVQEPKLKVECVKYWLRKADREYSVHLPADVMAPHRPVRSFSVDVLCCWVASGRRYPALALYVAELR